MPGGRKRQQTFNHKARSRDQNPKTFETQRNRGSGGKKEETGKSQLEEQKPNLNLRKCREGARDSKRLTTKLAAETKTQKPLKRRGTEEAEGRKRKPENRNLKSKSQI